MTILVCDDHPLVRTALAATVANLIIGQEVRTARNFEEAWRLAELEDEVLLCIVDLHMPGAGPREGLAGIKLRAPEAKLVVVTGSESDADLVDALTLGVDGFVPKSAEAGVVEAAIGLVMAGGRFLPPRVAELLAANGQLATATQETGAGSLDQPKASLQTVYGRISGRQRDVLKLVAQGRANKEIAKALDLSPATVKTHVASIIAALGAANRTEAAARARESGLLS